MQLQNVLYFLLWAGVFFVMMRFGCGAHIMGHGHHHGEADQDQGSGSGGRLLPPEKATVMPAPVTSHEKEHHHGGS